MIYARFKGGHGDGERMEIEADYPPPTLDARCPDCGDRTTYELLSSKLTRRGFRATYRAQAAREADGQT